jgi:hypothetical protein
VRGRSTAVTAVAGTYQCAEMHTIARGRRIDCPNADQPSVNALRASAFIGLP